MLAPTPATVPPPRTDAERAQRLGRMRRVAGGLLLAMGLLFIVASYLQRSIPLFSYLRAFAEAALVGGLADWFAVTALFRHPLGLPIPHTAIIPVNQARIAKGLGGFVQQNFLSAEALRTRLEQWDVAARAQQWMASPTNRSQLAHRLLNTLPAILKALPQAKLQELIHQALYQQVSKLNLAPLVAGGIRLLQQNGGTEAVVEELLALGAKVLNENTATLSAQLRQETPWFVPAFVDRKLSERLISRSYELIAEVRQDAAHPLRTKLEEMVQELAEKFDHSPDYHARLQRFQEELWQHPAVQQYVQNLLPALRQRLLNDLAQPEPALLEQLTQVLQGVYEHFLADAAWRKQLNTSLTEGVLQLLETQREPIAGLITDTVATWNPNTLTEKLELLVGRDLQFIRVNGTLVGGLVGLALYILSKFW